MNDSIKGILRIEGTYLLYGCLSRNHIVEKLQLWILLKHAVTTSSSLMTSLH